MITIEFLNDNNLCLGHAELKENYVFVLPSGCEEIHFFTDKNKAKCNILNMDLKQSLENK